VRASSLSTKSTDSAKRPQKGEAKSKQFDDDDEEATHEWTMPILNKSSKASEASVNLAAVADDWTTVDEPIDLNTGELTIVPRLEPKIIAKPESKASAKSEPKHPEPKENSGGKRRIRDAVSSDPLVSRPFTQAVRVAVSRNASGVIVARLLDLAGQLRDGEVEAMLVGLRAGELEELFR
jgi:hypothetical protein